MVQITVLKHEKHITDEGWEEWTDATPVLLSPGETKDITVNDGYFVKMADGKGSVGLRKVN